MVSDLTDTVPAVSLESVLRLELTELRGELETVIILFCFGVVNEFV